MSGSLTNLQNGLTISLQNLAFQTQKSGLVCTLPQDYQPDEIPPDSVICNNKKDTIVKATDF